MFAATICAILFSRFLFADWVKESEDEILDTLGIITMLFGFLFRIAARGHKAQVSGEGKNLIIDGPYRLIRNPMFFGTFLIGAGIVMVIFKWWVFLVFIAVFLAVYIPQVEKESSHLLGRFGDEYRKYCRETPLFFPNIIHLLLGGRRRYLFFRWGWIKREWPSLVSVFTVVLLIETWKDTRLFGAQEFPKELLESFATILIGSLVISLLFYEKENIPRAK